MVGVKILKDTRGLIGKVVNKITKGTHPEDAAKRITGAVFCHTRQLLILHTIRFLGEQVSTCGSKYRCLPVKNDKYFE